MNLKSPASGKYQKANMLISHQEAYWAGLDPNDIDNANVLLHLLIGWDYSTEASAQIAYNEPSIERLQLLRQIARILKKGMGFNQLFNILKPKPRQLKYRKTLAAGKALQPWISLSSRVRLRSFVKKHKGFLCGRVINRKWETNLPQRCDSVYLNTIGKEPSETPSLRTALTEKIAQLLSTRFPNGYRIESQIELTRYRSFAIEAYGEDIALPDDELKKCILACGTVDNGKVYAVSAQAKDQIKALAEKYFADGALAIFFDEFYAKNENWLLGISIVSQEMLINILHRLFPMLSFTQTYFGYTDVSIFIAIENEILRVWGNDVLLTYGRIAERLQYIPIRRIRATLGRNKDFIWSNVETYSHISMIDITDEERENIHKATMQACNKRGYASITDLPIWGITERNYELSATAIHNAVFRICLMDTFDKKGKIVTRKGDTRDALTILKDFCRTIDKCSLNDLMSYEKKLTGETHYWIPMKAGYTILVRIDKDIFVADKFVYFNSDAVDAAIELFINGDYLPLKSFTTFWAFPDCGQTWNLFLLESYCRRFSKKFRFDAPSVNSRNAGAVIRKSYTLSYSEIMIDAVVKAAIPMTGSVISRFLFDSGYIGKSTTAKITKIVEEAKAMRERVN